MANTQTSPGRFKRMLRWFGRHKVTAVFTILLLALCIWLFGSWVVWNVEVSSERKSFNSAYSYLRNEKHFITSMGSPAIGSTRFCSYRGDTGFGRKWLSCEVDSNATYRLITKQQAEIIDSHLKATLKQSSSFHINNPSEDYYELSSYSFRYQGLECEAGTQYYDKNVSNYSVYGDSVNPANSARISLSCSQDAEVEYFPVTKD